MRSKGVVMKLTIPKRKDGMEAGREGVRISDDDYYRGQE